MYLFNKYKNEVIGSLIGFTLGTIIYISFKPKGKHKFINYYGSKGQLPEAFPRGIRNNNPGNIRISKNEWAGKVPVEKNTDKSFEQFYNYTYGIMALIKLLKRYFGKGRNSISKIISVYAPATENDTTEYINNVKNTTGFGKNEELDWNKRVIMKLITAIIRQENGGFYMTYAQFNNAWNKI